LSPWRSGLPWKPYLRAPWTCEVFDLEKETPCSIRGSNSAANIGLKKFARPTSLFPPLVLHLLKFYHDPCLASFIARGGIHFALAKNEILFDSGVHLVRSLHHPHPHTLYILFP
jgi:hypothetical protein